MMKLARISFLTFSIGTGVGRGDGEKGKQTCRPPLSFKRIFLFVVVVLFLFYTEKFQCLCVGKFFGHFLLSCLLSAHVSSGQYTDTNAKHLCTQIALCAHNNFVLPLLVTDILDHQISIVIIPVYIQFIVLFIDFITGSFCLSHLCALAFVDSSYLCYRKVYK